MRRLARRIGLGLAARGEVENVVALAGEARTAGLDPVWIRDGYYERHPISYASAVASVATGQARAIAMTDLETARLHLAFGVLLVAGVLLSRLLPA